MCSLESAILRQKPSIRSKECCLKLHTKRSRTRESLWRVFRVQIQVYIAQFQITTTRTSWAGIPSYLQGEILHVVRFLWDTNIWQATDSPGLELHSFPIAFRIYLTCMGQASLSIQHVPVDLLRSMKLAKPFGLER